MTTDTDQGANLAFRIDPPGPPLVVRLDRVAAGLECPMFLKAQGPVNVAGQTIQVTISYGIEGFGLRYRVMSLSLTVSEWDEDSARSFCGVSAGRRWSPPASTRSPGSSPSIPKTPRNLPPVR